ncbi:MAG TPA: UDP-N-acetylglucosamine--LPS N-acetylglucosamine transferase [Actinomycetes bacterium]|nr:UDP-N-acetylglucosamine--LPS N-acetylglucosamine transferase [Actinomycetes bacterium]
MSSGGAKRGAARVLLVASAGGHLAQLLELRPWWSRYERVWVTFDKADARSRLAGEQIVYAHHPTTRNIPIALRNLVLAVRTLRRLRPDLVVSTGAGVAYPMFLVARVMRIPLLYLEVYDRTDTLTGRLCHPLVSAFAAQWPEQVERYPGAELVGPVL